MNAITERLPLVDFTEKAYLDYSMYVILDRALPHLADGFKPVQRRIVYAMSELGLNASAKFKKSARTVGDVLGKFHPHGDSACYEAMVLMAQAFSYRYPLVDGQGNWGSSDDPKSFAAMRYTEAKLSNYAELLLSELQLGTVDWQDNFDGTLKEPVLLPARLPNILLNGATGIAVGMACDTVPHNLNEVCDAIVHLLDNPKAELTDILTFIQGPDFPTNAHIITPPDMIEEIYRTGQGSIKLRARFHVEKHQIVIDALPYQVSGSKVLEQVAQQMQQKKLPMVDDLRDESDHEHPTRFVIVPRSNRVDIDALMNHLFATTDLEKNYRINFNMIGLNGRPEVKPLLNILNEWLSFRLQTVVKRLEYRLSQVIDRLHILEGLLIAYLNLDAVIQIIREQDDAKQALIDTFKLTREQAQAILEIKLRQLAKLEEIKLRREHEALSQEKAELEAYLNSEKRLKQLVKKEVLEDKKNFGDVRRSMLIKSTQAQAFKEEDIIASDPITVVLSEKGWVRAAKGHDVDGSALNFKAQDGFKMQANAKTNSPVVFFDASGKVYSLPGHSLPSARSQGEPLSGKLTIADGIAFTHVLSGELTDWVLLATDAGYGFITQLASIIVKNRSGKQCVNLPENSQLLTPRVFKGAFNDLNIAVVSSSGRLLIFDAQALPILSRGKGNQLMQIPKAKFNSQEECVRDVMVFTKRDSLIIYAGKRHFTLKPDDIAHFEGARGRRGNLLPRGLQQVSALGVATS